MKVIFVVGPTGSGKSDLAVNWAKAVQGHILNADSVQFFQSLHIGANKPSEQVQIQVPHHLLDIVKEGDHFTAGDFRRVALEKLAILNQQQVPYVFIVGGSGFYLQALLKGMYPIPKSSTQGRHDVVNDLKAYGLGFLYGQLQAKDPLYAKKIHPKDTHRILRSLEILRKQSQTLTEVMDSFQPQSFPYPQKMVGLKCDRRALKVKLQERTDRMLKAGFIEEVQNLRQKGLKDWSPLTSVGYKQVMDFLDGRIEKKCLFQAIVQANMRLAKKQMTWFKNKCEIIWIEADQFNEVSFFHKVMSFEKEKL